MARQDQAPQARWRRSVVFAAAAAMAGCSHAPPPRFPGQIPSYLTNISSAEAFREHHIKMPAGVRDLRYAADDGPKGSDVVAVFGIPCAAAPEFIKSNHLSRVATSDDLSVDYVWLDALKLGWKQNDPLARWYEQPGGTLAQLYAMITGSKDRCTVYLDEGSEESQ